MSKRLPAAARHQARTTSDCHRGHIVLIFQHTAARAKALICGRLDAAAVITDVGPTEVVGHHGQDAGTFSGLGGRRRPTASRRSMSEQCGTETFARASAPG